MEPRTWIEQANLILTKDVLYQTELSEHSLLIFQGRWVLTPQPSVLETGALQLSYYPMDEEFVEYMWKKWSGCRHSCGNSLTDEWRSLVKCFLCERYGPVPASPDSPHLRAKDRTRIQKKKHKNGGR